MNPHSDRRIMYRSLTNPECNWGPASGAGFPGKRLSRRYEMKRILHRRGITGALRTWQRIISKRHSRPEISLALSSKQESVHLYISFLFHHVGLSNQCGYEARDFRYESLYKICFYTTSQPEGPSTNYASGNTLGARNKNEPTVSYVSELLLDFNEEYSYSRIPYRLQPYNITITGDI